MFTYFRKIQFKFVMRVLRLIIVFSFVLNCVILPSQSAAQSSFGRAFFLPTPGVMVPPSLGFEPVLVKGLQIYQDDPLKFDFIVDNGDNNLTGEALKEESTTLIKYFLAALTVPEEDLWVNLSPYEEGRIIPSALGMTTMGRDLLGQDYILKQVTSSLMYPEKDLGFEFWDKIYERAYELYGSTDIPINTFNKVWIVPETAIVYEAEDNTVFVLDSHLKVMLEEDYLAVDNNLNNEKFGTNELADENIKDLSRVSSKVVREILIPVIEKEVNEGENFAALRQMNQALILAIWYKKALKDSLLGQVYVDKNKIKGIDIEDKEAVEKIYQQYIEAFKKGVYDYTKDDFDPFTQQIIPRRYFSGGYTTALGETKFGDRITRVRGKQGIASSPFREKIIKAINNLKESVDKGLFNLTVRATESEEDQILKDLIKKFPEVTDGDVVLTQDILKSINRLEWDVPPVVLENSEAYVFVLRVYANKKGFSLEEYREFLVQSLEEDVLQEKQKITNIIMDSLAEYTSTTNFFREQTKYREEILELIKSKWESGDLNIRGRHVSASSGEEVYTAIILYNESLKALYKELKQSNQVNDFTSFREWRQQWNVEVDAFDISIFNLRKVQQAIYGKNIQSDLELGLDQNVISEYFEDYSESEYKISQDILEWAKVNPIYIDLTQADQLDLLGTYEYDSTFSLNTASIYPSVGEHVVLGKLADSQSKNSSIFISDKFSFLSKNGNAEFLSEKMKNKFQIRFQQAFTEQYFLLALGILGKDVIQPFLQERNVDDVLQGVNNEHSEVLIDWVEQRIRNINTEDAVENQVDDAALGGIDFNPANLNLQIERDGRGVALPVGLQDVEGINIEGLFPVIINMAPVQSLPLPLLGELEEGEDAGSEIEVFPESAFWRKEKYLELETVI